MSARLPIAPWLLSLAPLGVAIWVTSRSREPALLADGLSPAVLDSFGGEIFALRGEKPLALDGLTPARSLPVSVPPDAGIVVWDPAQRVCWATASRVACDDLLDGHRVEVPVDGPVLDIQLTCTGLAVLLGGPARLVLSGTDGAVSGVPLQSDVVGLARGSDCAHVGGRTADGLGDIDLADGTFTLETHVAGLRDGARMDAGWIVVDDAGVERVDASGVIIRKWAVPHATRAVPWGGTASAAALDADGRLWALP